VYARNIHNCPHPAEFARELKLCSMWKKLLNFVADLIEFYCQFAWILLNFVDLCWCGELLMYVHARVWCTSLLLEKSCPVIFRKSDLYLVALLWKMICIIIWLYPSHTETHPHAQRTDRIQAYLLFSLPLILLHFLLFLLDHPAQHTHIHTHTHISIYMCVFIYSYTRTERERETHTNTQIHVMCVIHHFLASFSLSPG